MFGLRRPRLRSGVLTVPWVILAGLAGIAAIAGVHIYLNRKSREIVGDDKPNDSDSAAQ